MRVVPSAALASLVPGAHLPPVTVRSESQPANAPVVVESGESPPVFPASRPLAEAWSRHPLTAAAVVQRPEGFVRLRPTAPVSSGDAGGATTSVRAARLAALAAVPAGQALARERALFVFEHFLRSERLEWADVTPEVAADFVMWRVAPPLGSAPPPAAFAPAGVVEACTAAGDLSAIRAHWMAVQGPKGPIAAALYGSAVTRTLERLGMRIKPDAVRKTPVPLAALMALTTAASALPGDRVLCRDVALMAVGLFAFARGGELDFDVADVVEQDQQSLTFVFRHEKARGGAARCAMGRPRSRTCSHPLLLLAWSLYRPHRPSGGRLFPLDASSRGSRRLRHVPWSDLVRAVLLARLGRPPCLAGERQPLPWSLRCGMASACFAAGFSIELIMRLGRWASSAAVLYCVLTPSALTSLWRGADLVPLSDVQWAPDPASPPPCL